VNRCCLPVAISKDVAIGPCTKYPEIIGDNSQEYARKPLMRLTELMRRFMHCQAMGKGTNVSH
jgi:hypothetical protein